MPEIMQFVPILIVGFAGSLALTPLSRQIAMRLGVVDKPNQRKIHLDHKPMMGGLAIYVALSIALLLFSPPRHVAAFGAVHVQRRVAADHVDRNLLSAVKDRQDVSGVGHHVIVGDDVAFLIDDETAAQCVVIATPGRKPTGATDHRAGRAQMDHRRAQLVDQIHKRSGRGGVQDFDGGRRLGRGRAGGTLVRRGHFARATTDRRDKKQDLKLSAHPRTAREDRREGCARAFPRHRTGCRGFFPRGCQGCR